MIDREREQEDTQFNDHQSMDMYIYIYIYSSSTNSLLTSRNIYHLGICWVPSLEFVRRYRVVYPSHPIQTLKIASALHPSFLLRCSCLVATQGRANLVYNEEQSSCGSRVSCRCCFERGLWKEERRAIHC